jgi:glutamate/tyrosine decarboxylase-like PLP-dependent enzyme
MTVSTKTSARHAPIDIDSSEFRRIGHELVDRVAGLLDTLPERRVTSGLSPADVRAVIGDGPLPEQGSSPSELLAHATRVLADNSLLNGHPRFWGFITASPAPIGMLADLLAAAVNPNGGAYVLSPVATEIERQTVRWIAELLGYPTNCGGIMVSGGNMANMVAFLAARRARASWDVRHDGLRGGSASLVVYASAETHTWVQKAADLFGLGLAAIRWIETDDQLRMNIADLDRAIVDDRTAGRLPFLVVGTAGTVSTGAIDPLVDIAAICRRHDLWLHVDGAYGAPAAVLPEAPPDLKAISLADSIAVDPHKWLYAPLEAGCTLVRNAEHLHDAFAFHPRYYAFADGGSVEPPTNFHEYGPQNSRGFRALKVWLALRQVGRAGYVRMIRDDIDLARAMHDAVSAHPDLETFTCHLSITTFRYVPPGIDRNAAGSQEYLDELNRAVVERLQLGGEIFVSNAVIGGRYLLRACVVNFRTSREDVEAVPAIVARVGAALHSELAVRHDRRP